jgi:hypothetical protein
MNSSTTTDLRIRSLRERREAIDGLSQSKVSKEGRAGIQRFLISGLVACLPEKPASFRNAASKRAQARA